MKKQDAPGARPASSPFRIVQSLGQAKDIVGGNLIKPAELDEIVDIIPRLSQLIF